MLFFGRWPGNEINFQLFMEFKKKDELSKVYNVASAAHFSHNFDLLSSMSMDSVRFNVNSCC